MYCKLKQCLNNDKGKCTCDVVRWEGNRCNEYINAVQAMQDNQGVDKDKCLK